MLIICDIDGTLTHTNEVDTRCFLESLRTVVGIDLGEADWNDFPDSTDTAIVHELLKDRPGPEIADLESAIRTDFVGRLTSASLADPDQFTALPGAESFIRQIPSHPDLELAIATGGWLESAQIKLRSAGIDARDLPIATSSDRARRTDIIRLAAERANRPLQSSVYLGDAPWDQRAARELGIPFIGIGPQWLTAGCDGLHGAFPDFLDIKSILKTIVT